MTNLFSYIYQISDETDKKGFLVGSLHLSVSPSEYEKLVERMGELTTQVNRVYLECVLPHHTVLPFGFEKAALQSIDQLNASEKLMYLESNYFQYAMLNSSIWIGSKIRHMPWLSYKILSRHPYFWFWIAKTCARLAGIYNVFYNAFTFGKHTAARQTFAAEQNHVLVSMVKNFSEGKPIILSERDQKMFLLKERSEHIFTEIVKDFSGQGTALYMTGAAHLYGPSGILELLRVAGYKVKLIPTTNCPA